LKVEIFNFLQSKSTEGANSHGQSCEQSPKREREGQKSRLPDKTRGFVQLAFANGVVERVDKEKQSATLEESERWEKKKWLLVRYVVDDQSTLEDVKMYAGVNNRERARQLFSRALTEIWRASPPEIKSQFSPKEIFKGKSRHRGRGIFKKTI
jgi:hypothetical protein